MKVELKGNGTKSAKPYPKLMRNSATGSIFIMHGYGEGTVLYSAAGTQVGIGSYSDGKNMSALEDYKGSICLSND